MVRLFGQIEPGGFAFIPTRFLRDGFLSSITPQERYFYLLLALAVDRTRVDSRERLGVDKDCGGLPLQRQRCRYRRMGVLY